MHIEIVFKVNKGVNKAPANSKKVPSKRPNRLSKN